MKMKDEDEEKGRTTMHSGMYKTRCETLSNEKHDLLHTGISLDPGEETASGLEERSPRPPSVFSRSLNGLWSLKWRVQGCVEVGVEGRLPRKLITDLTDSVRRPMDQSEMDKSLISGNLRNDENAQLNSAGVKEPV
ncbi:hypothetical protein RvY_17115 [Ramazzottius varieornatus]|uniref:Uncharacterized protein n=1 Tax=Ramazzottius varieornatus TaxID=947166 RepID=A0A1D1W735_RAMVA|nr:hypothetical protein RvY_17115 [Ramazzottius varieornatus]